MSDIFVLVEKGIISATVARDRYDDCMRSGKDHYDYFSSIGMLIGDGEDELHWIMQYINQSRKMPSVGNIQILSGGRADPKKVKEMLDIFDIVRKYSI